MRAFFKTDNGGNGTIFFTRYKKSINCIYYYTIKNNKLLFNFYGDFFGA